MIAVILGANGGIGSATLQLFISKGWYVIPITKSQIDFTKVDSYQKLSSILNRSRPNVIINSVGIFENGYDVDYKDTMAINFGSNWDIIRWLEKNKNLATSLVMIGSSSYTSGRKLYPLYSASKAALFNLWQSAKEQFNDTNIYVHLLNPVRTLTKMATSGKDIDPNLDYLLPEQVATEIFMLCQQNCLSSCIDMSFENENENRNNR